jgi:small-conductance mechanosensitive channel
MALFDRLPWLQPAFFTLVTVGVAFVLGHVFKTIVAGRLARLTSRTPGEWDDLLVSEIRPRIPLWSVLVGLWWSLGYWTFDPRWFRIASGAISVAGFASVTFALSAIATRFVAAYGPRSAPGAPVSGLTQNIVRLVVLSVGLLVMLNELGVEIRPMLAALGVGGLAVALGLQESLSNLFAGLFISMAGQVRIGDHVRLDGGLEGRVVDFNWRSTWLELPSASIAVVPNAKLSQAIVTNYNLPAADVAVPIDFVVDPAAALDHVERVALAAGRTVRDQTPEALAAFDPVVTFLGCGDLGVRGVLLLRARSFPDAAPVRHATVKALLAAFRDAGIAVPTLARLRP